MRNIEVFALNDLDNEGHVHQLPIEFLNIYKLLIMLEFGLNQYTRQKLLRYSHNKT